MKLRILAAALVAWAALCGPAQAAFTVTLKDSVFVSSNHALTSGSFNATAGKILVVLGVGRKAALGDVIGISNTNGDAWTIRECNGGGSTSSFIAYAVTTGFVGGTVSIVDGGAAVFTTAVMSVVEVDGGLGSSVEDTAGYACSGAGGTTTSPSLTSGDPAGTDSLMLSSYGVQTTITGLGYTEDTANGWTQIGVTGGDTNAAGAFGYVVNTGSGTKVHNPTTASRAYRMNTLALFAAAPPAASSAHRGALLGVGQ